MALPFGSKTSPLSLMSIPPNVPKKTEGVVLTAYNVPSNLSKYLADLK